MSVTVQRWESDHYMQHAGFVPKLGLGVVEWLAPRPGERVLDIGCGEGSLTEALVAAGCTVVGIDSSAEQVEAARLRGLDARVVDAHALPFRQEFDAVFSNAALHWMKHPDAVIAGVCRALKPGGRFVGECGAAGNVGAIHAALGRALQRRGIDARRVDPWYFPTPEDYRARLESAGLHVRRIERFPRPTPLPTDMAGWLATFAQSFTQALPPAERPSFLGEVLAELEPELRAEDGRWTADYVRLRFAADKPA
ncbi:methyltransferase domain-containing protein [Azospirillum sp. TSO22-1]|uniref:methyltransferase domain-containing protein n=1 Tax=Azospirillum sp. TSO22-1 TaxID=716789 RepID=UPI001FFFC2BF|nr:methyltransferase domain-containing protein [Azospirillum sp. TSO22-1]